MINYWKILEHYKTLINYERSSIMNYDEILKSIMLGEKIYNLPLRVCYYARVSTDSDVQLNSLDNQLEYYENYIKSKLKKKKKKK